MNVLAAYNSFSNLNTATIKPDNSESENKTKSLLPVPVELSHGQGKKYNYYVLEDNNEIIYNTKQNTEKINHSLLGSIINIFA